MSIHPFAVLLIAMVAVVGGILVLRLHAFLALTLGALLVACLTPRSALFDEAIRTDGRVVKQVTPEGVLQMGDGDAVRPNRYYVFRHDEDSNGLIELAVVEVDASGTEQSIAVRVTTAAGDAAKISDLRAGDVLVSPDGVTTAETAAGKGVGHRLAAGFGATCASIGLLIAMASIIGKCLLESRAAEQIVATLRGWFGERLTPVALAVSSFILAIPVFFDTVFYLMIPLAKELARKTGGNYLLYILSIVAGGSIAHSLVPPTPGPLFVANELGVNIGLMMIGGVTVASCGVLLTFPYILWANKRWPLRLPKEDGALPGGAVSKDSEPTAGGSRGDESTMDSPAPPTFWLSVLPIVLPVLLIGGRTVVEAIAGSDSSLADSAVVTSVVPFFEFAGDKNIALILAAAVALATLWTRTGAHKSRIRDSVQDALSSAGVIILITSAGGAFGKALKSTGIAAALQESVPQSETGVGLILLAFGLTTLVRTAQGSATVAMIASAGIVAPLAATIELPYHPLYLALAIGAGSKPISWMNDSGFWIVGKMSGMNEAETLRSFSMVLLLMGLGCLAAIVAGAVWVPLV